MNNQDLIDLGYDLDAELLKLFKCMKPQYLDHAENESLIISNDEGYKEIDVDYKIVNLIGTLIKGDVRDIDSFDKAIEIDSDVDFSDVNISIHGNKVLTNTTGVSNIQLLKIDSNVDNIDKDILRELRFLIHSLIMYNGDSIYHSIKRLSKIKDDLASKNKDVEPVRKRPNIMKQTVWRL